MNRPPARERRSLVALAGWLFADLMLVIMVVALGSQADPLIAPGPVKATSKPSPTPTPKPTPKPTTPPRPATIEQNPVIIEVSGKTGSSDLESLLTARLKPYLNRRAGIVLTFGYGPDPNVDTDYATNLNEMLSTTAPAVFPPGTPMKSYLYLKPGVSNQGEIQIFLFTPGS